MKVSDSPHLDGTGGQGEVSGASQTSARVQRGYGVGVRHVTTSTFTHFLMLFRSVSVLDVKFMCMTACVCVCWYQEAILSNPVYGVYMSTPGAVQ